MKKSVKNPKKEVLKELPIVDYSNIPKEILEALSEKPHVIEKKVRLSWDGKQFILRIPKEITEEMNITKESQIQFKVIKPKPNTEEENILEIELVNS
jgi:hypothetical protein